jgi:hypothetical protein
MQNVKRSNLQLAESFSIVIVITYHIYCRLLCFSCAGTANGMDLKVMKSRGTEEWWSSWKRCSGKLCLKNDKMNNVIMDCELILIFGNKFLVM